MKRQIALFVATLLFYEASIAGESVREERKKPPLQVDYGDCTFRWESKLKLDAVGTTNANRLNSANCDLDKTAIPGRFVYDGVFLNFFHNPKCGWDTARIKTGLRWRGIFGAPESSYKTGAATIKDTNIPLAAHTHPLTIHVPIIREIWGEFNLNELLNLSFSKPHTFTMGLFPFYLGRGIALGDAFSVVPDFIGYDPATSVDQYAPGFRLSGSFCANHQLDYDVYGEITDNFSDTFSNINVKNQGQFFGHRFEQARGFGAIDYIVAGRLLWKPIDCNGHKLTLEPYLLFNNENCQKVEVQNDASSKLATVGLALELTWGKWEFGFDTAHNFGHQNVKGLDRNVVTRSVRTVPDIGVGGSCTPAGDQSAVVLVNSHVVLVSDGKTTVPYNPCSSPGLQAAIDAPIENSSCESCLEQLNGQVLSVELFDTVADTSLEVMNAPNRFRNAHQHEFTGSMFVADMTYRIRKGFRLASMVGYATGDDNPHTDRDTLGDSSQGRDFHGFIGLQEVYSGNRVRSAFMLGGLGRIPRLSSFPKSTSSADLPGILRPTDPFPTSLSRFSNLALLGGSIWWETEECSRKWVLNPNIITYWQPVPPRIFTSQDDGSTLCHTADKHLGTELNIFVDNLVAPGLKLFFVAGCFIPGRYFDDLKGHAISKAEQQYLNYLDGKGGPADKVPLIGNDPAFFINLGIEYKF